jgi:tetratricopeptide (TPR) repeat protein
LCCVVAGQTQQAGPESDKTIIKATEASTYTPPKLSPEVEKDKHYAFELRNADKFLEALPWFEKVVKEAPNDAESIQELAACLLAHSATVQDAGQKKAERIRTRELLLRARALGYNSDYVATLLSTLPEDGAAPNFSKDNEVDRIMKRAEAAFSAGKFEDAKQAYLQALVLEPKNYAATLFIGDVYFATKQYVAAGEWFSRAIEIDPNRELAYRYWGDALLGNGKLQEARTKFIEAVVAQPYERSSWNGVNKWARYRKQNVTWYQFKSPNQLKMKENGNMDIVLDSDSLDKKDGSGAWMGYEIARAAWRGDKFKEEFPNEKQYRHTLKEESEALAMVAELAESRAKEGERLKEDLTALVGLRKKGLIEAYVLFNAADEGISQDYDVYRKEHRDKLVQYLDQVVVPQLGKDN